jgi:hypothetical protein
MAGKPSEHAADALQREREDLLQRLAAAKGEVARLTAKYEPPTPLSGSSAADQLGHGCALAVAIVLAVVLVAMLFASASGGSGWDR